MSLPLVEKYRPKTQTDLIGNEVAINGLILFLKRWTPRKAPMASLLLGPAGSGKTSSVHFLHFKFEDHHVRDFKDMDCTVEIGTDHEQYPHISVLTNEVKTALIKDFD